MNFDELCEKSQKAVRFMKKSGKAAVEKVREGMDKMDGKGEKIAEGILVGGATGLGITLFIAGLPLVALGALAGLAVGACAEEDGEQKN